MQYSYAPQQGPGMYVQPYYDPEQVEKERRAQKKEAKKKLIQSDTNTFVKFFLAIGVLTTAMTIFSACGNCWQYKHFSGFGVSSLKINVSLLTMSVNVDCGKNILENQLCKQLKKFEGTNSLMRTKEAACVISTGHILATPEACTMMEFVVYSSFALFVLVIMGACCIMVGLIFLYHYWYVEQRGKSKEWAFTLYMSGLIVIIVGFIAYSGCSPDLSNFPGAFGGHAYTMLGGSRGIFGMESSHDMPWGWSWFAMALTILFIGGNLLSWAYFMNPHINEKTTEKAAKWQKQQAEETAAMIGYGTMHMMEEAKLNEAQQQQIQQGTPGYYDQYGYASQGPPVQPGYEATTDSYSVPPPPQPYDSYSVPPPQQAYDGYSAPPQQAYDGYSAPPPPQPYEYS